MSDQFAPDVTVDGVRGHGENFFLGLMAGIIAAIVGAGIWMGLTVATGMHVGYVAIGVGALVGFAIRLVGNGRSMIFGITGAVLTFVSCLTGEVAAVIQRSTSPESDFFAVLKAVDLTQLVSNIFAHTDPIMYFIYAIGIFEGYKLSMRK